MVYTASKQGEMSSTVMKVTETRGTKTIGSVMREMYFQTLTEQTSPPFFTSADTLSYCAEGSINVPIEGSSNLPNMPLEIIWNNKSRLGWRKCHYNKRNEKCNVCTFCISYKCVYQKNWI